MAVILSIDTSTNVCSTALSSDGFIIQHSEDFDGPNHAAILSDFIKRALDHISEHEGMKLDAIAVSLGPGSYTGLRIGLSESKGLAYSLNLPLIGVNTLKILAVEAMFSVPDFDPENDLIIPMLDARRNEVYTAVYDGTLEAVLEPVPMILCPDSFSDLKKKGLIFIGNGATKAKEIIEINKENMIFLCDVPPLATSMISLAERAYFNNDFINIAYSVPIYLKEFQTTTPNPRI